MAKLKNEASETIVHIKRYRWVAAIAFTLIGIGTVFYHIVENWKLIDSLYFSTVTLTTIGYGDFTPKTDAGKLFTVFYVLIGVGTVAAALNILVRGAAQRRLEKLRTQAEEDPEKDRTL